MLSRCELVADSVSYTIFGGLDFRFCRRSGISTSLAGWALEYRADGRSSYIFEDERLLSTDLAGLLLRLIVSDTALALGVFSYLVSSLEYRTGFLLYRIFGRGMLSFEARRVGEDTILLVVKQVSGF